MDKAIKYSLTGECEIDVKQVIKKWTLLCRIYKHNSTYKLIVLTPKGKNKIKIEIKKEDAIEIINQLNLIGIPKSMLKMNYTIYLSV